VPEKEVTAPKPFYIKNKIDLLAELQNGHLMFGHIIARLAARKATSQI
jgi:hypothetical protein